MLRGVDHIAIAAPDPDAAAAALEDLVGLSAQGGGRHEAFGTRNRLAWLADGSYLELLGVEDEAAAASWPMGAAAIGALRTGGGFAAYALDDRPLEPDVHALRGYGSQIGDPVRGSRRRDDGEVVEWWTALPPRIGPDGLPFLIEHVMVGAEWGTHALNERAGYRHPIGSPVRLVRVDVAVDDPAASAAEHSKQLGMLFQAAGDLAVCTVGQHVVRLVPRSVAAASLVVTLAAAAAPRTADLLGVRFVVEHAVLSPVT
ncbi:MAG TPA: VOC family protein [Candidatus Limnocylindria bacterium]|nr:VOC family protein [Candidatus Limnocylindria bacterium]